MKSAVVAVISSLVVWALIVPVFHLVPGVSRQNPVAFSLMVAVAGGLLASGLLKASIRSPELLSSAGLFALFAAAGSGIVLFSTALLIKNPTRPIVYCPSITGEKAAFNSTEAKPYINYLNPGEKLEWEVRGRSATSVTIQFASKNVPGCSGDSPFDDGTQKIDLNVGWLGKSWKLSPGAKKVLGGKCECFTYTITCKSGEIVDTIDPMIDIPRPPGLGPGGDSGCP